MKENDEDQTVPQNRERTSPGKSLNGCFDMLLSEILMLLVDDFDKKAKELSNVVRVIIKAKKVTRIDGTIFRFAGCTCWKNLCDS